MMNSNSNSSGKRQIEGLLNNTTKSSGSDVALGGGDMSMKSDNICNDDTQKLSQSSNSEMMREDRDNNCSGKFDDMQESGCSDSDSSDSDGERDSESNSE